MEDKFQGPTKRKNVALALVLAVVVSGLGHIYIGYHRRGGIILLSVILIIVVRMLISPSNSQDYVGWGAVYASFGLVTFAIHLGQIYDAYILVKKVNKSIEQQALERPAHPLQQLMISQESRNKQSGRPQIVTTVAVLLSLGGIFAFLLGVNPTLMEDSLFPMVPDNLGLAYRTILIMEAVGTGIIIYGLLWRKSWVWPWALIGLLINFAWPFVDIAFVPQDIVGVVANSVMSGLYGIAIFYFRRQAIRRYFEPKVAQTI